MDGIGRALAVAREALGLKSVARAGWIIRDVRPAESVADHSWGTALLCLAFADLAREELPAIDPGRSVEMAVVHDLVEVETGDTPFHPDLDRDAKADAERRAMDRLLPAGGAGAGPRIRALWEEYEAASTDTARFVRDMNLIEMCVQAARYDDRDDRGLLREFGESSAPRLTTETGRSILDLIRGV